MNTYTKLRSGDWGVRGEGTAPSYGHQVTVTKKSGESKTETIEKIVWTGEGVWIAAIAKAAPPSRPAARTRRAPMGSGHGWSAPVAGYAAYCTDRPGCRCYDCV